ncbi:hypothetical protein, partial [Marivita geojedonensis]
PRKLLDIISEIDASSTSRQHSDPKNALEHWIGKKHFDDMRGLQIHDRVESIGSEYARRLDAISHFEVNGSNDIKDNE